MDNLDELYYIIEKIDELPRNERTLILTSLREVLVLTDIEELEPDSEYTGQINRIIDRDVLNIYDDEGLHSEIENMVKRLKKEKYVDKNRVFKSALEVYNEYKRYLLDLKRETSNTNRMDTKLNNVIVEDFLPVDLDEFPKSFFLKRILEDEDLDLDVTMIIINAINVYNPYSEYKKIMEFFSLLVEMDDPSKIDWFKIKDELWPERDDFDVRQGIDYINAKYGLYPGLHSVSSVSSVSSEEEDFSDSD